jgi:hypothetical protein
VLVLVIDLIAVEIIATFKDAFSITSLRKDKQTIEIQTELRFGVASFKATAKND